MAVVAEVSATGLPLRSAKVLTAESLRTAARMLDTK